MGIFHSHGVRKKAIIDAQRAFADAHGDPERSIQGMKDVFERYLARQKSGKVLDKAQALQNAHFSNRTAPEKQHFTIALMEACSERCPELPGALALADACDIVRVLARQQTAAVCYPAGDFTGEAGALEKAFLGVFSDVRAREALAFYVARMLPVEAQHECLAFYQSETWAQLRAKIAAALRASPECAPRGIDLLGMSPDTMLIRAAPPPGLENVSEERETQVRRLLELSWSPPISQEGLMGLCRGLTDADIDTLTAFYESEAFYQLLQVSRRFIAYLPEVRQDSVRWKMSEAMRDLQPARPKTRSARG